MIRLAVRAALIAATVVAFSGVAYADFLDRFGPPSRVELSDIRANPRAYLEQVVQFELRFNAYGDVYNPVFTRFVPERYVNFSGWGEEQLLYKQEEFVDPFPFLFMDKSHPEIKTLNKLTRFEPVLVTAYIHDYFQEMVWIDVVAVQQNDAGVLNERILIHITRGMEHFRQRRWDDCLREFKDALLYPLPHAYAAQVQKDVALVYYYKKGPAFLEAAEIELQRAVVLNPDHIYLRRLYARVQEQNRLAIEEGRRVKTRHGEEGTGQ
ncbi:MAG: hypothetical protein HY720_23690 [Planctomycetes bacterium]|nr:hypothetical protein [Planctomycetota bacterium]